MITVENSTAKPAVITSLSLTPSDASKTTPRLLSPIEGTSSLTPRTAALNSANSGSTKTTPRLLTPLEGNNITPRTAALNSPNNTSSKGPGLLNRKSLKPIEKGDSRYDVEGNALLLDSGRSKTIEESATPKSARTKLGESLFAVNEFMVHQSSELEIFSGPGSLIHTYKEIIDGEEFNVNLFDSPSEGYIITAVSVTTGKEYSCPLPTLSELKKVVGQDELDVAFDFYETLLKHLELKAVEPTISLDADQSIDLLASAPVEQQFQLSLKKTLPEKTPELSSLYKSDTIEISGLKSIVECLKQGSDCIFRVTVGEKEDITTLSLTTSALRLANMLSDVPDLMLSTDISIQMKALIPILTLYMDPNDQKQYLAFYLGSENVKIDGENVILTILEFENEIWCCIYNPIENKEYDVVIDGRDWMNFRSLFPLCISNTIMFHHLASRLIKVRRSTEDDDKVEDSYIFIVIDTATNGKLLIRRRSIEMLPERIQNLALEKLDEVNSRPIVRRKSITYSQTSMDSVIDDAKKEAFNNLNQIIASNALNSNNNERVNEDSAVIEQKSKSILRKTSAKPFVGFEIILERAKSFLSDTQSPAQKKAAKEAQARVLFSGNSLEKAKEEVLALRQASKEELKDKTSLKAFKLLGDELIIPNKAAKLIGSPMLAEQHRNLILSQQKSYKKSTTELVYESKRLALYSADTVRKHSSVNSKAINVLGDGGLLIGPKTRKLLGEEMNASAYKKMIVNDEKVKRDGISRAEEQERVDFQRKLSTHNALEKAPNNRISVKAMSLMGDSVLAGGKAEKIIGDEMSPVQYRKMLAADAVQLENGPSAEEIEWQLNLKKRIGAAEYQEQTLKEHNHSKVLQLTGESLLSGSKAEKLTGKEMTASQYRAMQKASEEDRLRGPTEEELEWQHEMKKRISAEQYLEADKLKHSHAKVLALTGESLLSGNKAEKIMGQEMSASERKAALENEKIELNREKTELEELEAMRMKRIYGRDELLAHGNVPNKKALHLMGDNLLMSDKALRILGDNKEMDLTVQSPKQTLVNKIRPNMRKLMAISIFSKANVPSILVPDKPTIRTSPKSKEPTSPKTTLSTQEHTIIVKEKIAEVKETKTSSPRDRSVSDVKKDFSNDIIGMLLNDTVDGETIPISETTLETLHEIMEICLDENMEEAEALSRVKALALFSEQHATSLQGRAGRAGGEKYSNVIEEMHNKDTRESMDVSSNSKVDEFENEDDDEEEIERQRKVSVYDPGTAVRGIRGEIINDDTKK